MKKTVIFAAILAAVLVFLSIFTMSQAMVLEDDGYILTEDIKGDLSKGVKEWDELVPLKEVSRGDVVYRRGNNLYVGEDKDRMMSAYPLLINDGTRIRFLDDAATLIDEELETVLTTYDGLYLSDGITFLTEGDQADVEIFVLAGLSNGLYMNAQEMTLEYAMGETVVRPHSFVSFSEDAVRFYYYVEGNLRYGEFTALTSAMIRIGNLYMPYQDFLDKLNGLMDGSDAEKPGADEKASDTAYEPEAGVVSGNVQGSDGSSDSSDDSQKEETSDKDKDGKGTASKGGASADGTGTQDNTASGGTAAGVKDTSGQDGGTGAGDGSGKGDGGKGDDGADSDSGSGSGGSSGKGDSSGTGGTADNSSGKNDSEEEGGNGNDITDDEGDGEIDEGDLIFSVEKPQVSIGDFVPGIYNITNQLSITDNYGVFIKATFELYWDNGSGEKVLKLRKSSKRAGDLDLKVVPPGTEILIKAYYTYYDSLGVKVEEPLLPDEGILVTTRPLSELEPFVSDYEYEEVLPRLSNQIQIQGLSMEIPTENLSYVNSLVVTVENEKGETKEIELEGNYLNALKNGEEVDWTSSPKLAEFITSDSSFTFHISLKDKFGNCLPLTTGEGQERLDYLGPYQARTCKVAPTATVTEDKTSEDIGEKTITVKLSDPDGAQFTTYETSDMELPEVCLAIYKIVDGEDVLVLLDDADGFYAGQGLTVVGNRYLALDRRALDNGQTLRIAGLTAGVNYRFQVLANYDIDDGMGLYDMEPIGESLMNAMPLSRLGYGYAAFSTTSIDDRSAVVNYRLNTEKTNSELNEWFAEFGLNVYEGNGTSKPVWQTVLYRDETGEEGALDGLAARIIDSSEKGSLVLHEGSETLPRVVLSGSAVTPGISAWDAILKGAAVQVSFPDKSLKSSTLYTMSMSTVAHQGGVSHNLSSPGNSATFRTLKLEPEIIWSDAYTISDFIEFRDFVIYDPDGAITGDVTIQLMTEGVTVKTWVVTPQSDETITIDVKRFENLNSNTTYNLRYYADSYNQTHSSANEVKKKELDSTHGKDGQKIANTFTIGAGIVGKLELLSLDNILEDTHTSIGASQLYDPDAVTDGIYVNGGTFPVSSGWRTSDYMQVTEDHFYLLYQCRSSSNIRVTFYKERISETDTSAEASAKVAGSSVYSMYVGGKYPDHLIIRAPKGAKYMRFSTAASVNVYIPKVLDISSLEGKSEQIFDNYSSYQGEVYEEGSGQLVEGADNTLLTSKTLAADGKISTASSTYAVSEKLKAQEGDLFMKMNGYTGSGMRISFFNEKDEVLSTAVFDIGLTVEAPAGTSYMRFSDYSAYMGAGRDRNSTTLKPSIRKINREGMANLMLKDDAFFQAEIQVSLTDPSQSLLSHPHYVLKWYKQEGTDGVDANAEEYKAASSGTFDIPVSADGTETQDVLRNFMEELEALCSYRVEMYIRLKDYDILLDSLEFDTSAVTYSIKNDKELAKIQADPAGRFRIIADFTTARTTWVLSSNVPFTGSLDGQGHTVTKTTPSYPWFYYIDTDAVVENLVIDWKVNLDSAMTWLNTGLCAYNRGTIRNVVEHIDLTGHFANRNFGGLVYTNYPTGVIENFAIYYDNTLYVQYGFGGACAYNQGTVQNGYSYGIGSPIQGTSGNYLGDSSSTRAYVGSIVGQNQAGGTVQNCYALNGMNTEYGSSMNCTGLVVGMNVGGQVQNCFSYGDHTYFQKQNGTILYSGRIYDSYGPVLGNADTVGWSLTDDLYYISKNTYKGKNQSVAEAESLWNEDWYYELFDDSKEENFSVAAQVEAGYFPIVNMPECMKEAQKNINLPAMTGKSYPDLIGVSVNAKGVDEEGYAYQEVTLSFSNSRRRQIMALEINGLMCDINLETQRSDGSNYLVDAVLRIPKGEEAKTNKPLYRSSYEVTHLTYQISALNQTYGDIYYGSASEFGVRKLSVQFFKEIRTVADWEAIDDYAGNYHVANDLDFQDKIGKELNVQAFTGILDGGQYDDEGNLTGVATMRNMYISPNGYLIRELAGATVENLRFENVKFDRTQSTVQYTGLIQYAAAQSEIRNVQVDQAVMEDITQVAGILVGRGYYTDISYCSVADVKLTTTNVSGKSLVVGGLAGQLERSTVTNCFARDVEIDATDGFDSNGIGGLVGRSVSGTRIENAYAQGTIDSTLSQLGGLVGRTAGSINRTWTNVDITTVSNQAGGIAGAVDASIGITRSLAVGEIYSQSGSTNLIGCIYGASLNGVTTTLSRSYGYEGQMINGQTPSDIKNFDMHATGILKANQIQGVNGATYYKKTIDIGSEFLTDNKPGITYPVPYEGAMPLLADEDGVTPMPNQLAVYPKDINLKISVGSHGKNANDDLYSMEMTVEYLLSSDYTITDIRMEGMKLGEPAASEKSDDGTKAAVTYKYNQIEPENYKDVYRLLVTVERPDGSTQTVSAMVDFGAIYREIDSAENWQIIMKEYGDSYENFKITGNIDFSGISDPVVNVKANRVTAVEGCSIRNLSYDTKTASDALFADIAAGIDTLRFENITWTNRSSGGINLGLIGKVGGEVKDLSFSDIKIIGNGSTYVGCIGTASGDIEQVTLDNIAVNNAGGYTGGLVGNALGSISQVKLTGSATSADSYGSSVTGPTKTYSYTGGIAGYCDGILTDISVDGIRVTGYNYVGGICGNVTSGTHKNLTVGSLKVPDGVKSAVSVSGTNYIGGAVGGNPNNSYDLMQSRIYQNVNTYRTAVSGSGNYIGGVAGYYTRIEGVRVIYPNITGGSYVGGIGGFYCYALDGQVIGEVTWDEKGTPVYNSTIMGGKYIGGTGGALGYTAKCAVYGMKIDGDQYIGGIIGTANNSNGSYAHGSFSVVNQCEIGSSRSSYVGGIAGDAVTGYNNPTYASGVLHTTIKADHHGGGIFGRTGGQNGAYRLYADVDVIVENEYAGAYAGEVISYYYSASTGQYYAKLYNSWFTGTVTGEGNYTAGLIGCFTPGTVPLDGEGAPVSTVEVPEKLWDDNFYQILMAVDVTSSANKLTGYYVVGADNSVDGAASDMQRMYIYEGSTKNGVPITKDSGEYTLVSADELTDKEFYINELGFSGDQWDYLGMDPVVSSTGVNLVPNGDGTLDIYAEGVAGEKNVILASNNYYQGSSLKLWLDGVNNSGTGHDRNAVSWTNLADPDGEAYPLLNFTQNGWKNDGLEFDGVNDYISLFPLADLGKSFTISTMVQFNKIQNTTVFGTWSSGTGGIFTGIYSSKLQARVGVSASELSFKNTADIETDKWYQLAVTVSTDEDTQEAAVIIYLDGKQVKTGKVSNMDYLNNLLVIGGRGWGSSYYLSGKIGNFMAYTEALSAEQVEQNYRADQARFGGQNDQAASVEKEVTFTDGEASLSVSAEDLETLGLTGSSKDTLFVMIEDADGNENSIGASVLYPIGEGSLTVTTVLSDPTYDNGDGTVSGSPIVEVTGMGDNASYQWYFGTQPGYNGTALPGETSFSLKLSGAGYFYCKVIDSSGKIGYSRVYRHMGVCYMPYVRNSTTSATTNFGTLPGQEGYYVGYDELGQGERLLDYSMTDNIVSGGVPVPGTASNTAWFSLMRMMMLADEELPTLKVYTSGANTLNLEFSDNVGYMDPSYFTSSYFVVEADGEEVQRSYIDNRVYTMTYDFSTDLTITVCNDDTGESQAYEIAAADVARDVMTWGDEYAYITSKGVRTGSGLVEGEFVNLYGGYALAADGTLHELGASDDGTAQSDGTAESGGAAQSSGGVTGDGTEWYALTDIRPLQSGTYTLDGSDVKLTTFAGFTVVERAAAGASAETVAETSAGAEASTAAETSTAAGAGAETSTAAGAEASTAAPAAASLANTSQLQREIKEYQIFVKNGQLFLGDPAWGMVHDGVIVDTYKGSSEQESRYFTVLLEDGYLEDVENAITVPEKFQNYGIAQMTNTLDSTSHLVLLRYNSGKVCGFNYLTGTEIDIAQDEIITDFVTYASDWLQARFFGNFQVSAENYTEAVNLTSAILLHPIDEIEEETEGWGTDAIDAYDGSAASLLTEGVNEAFTTEDVPLGSEETVSGSSTELATAQAGMQDDTQGQTTNAGSAEKGTQDDDSGLSMMTEPGEGQVSNDNGVTITDTTKDAYLIDGVKSTDPDAGIYSDQTVSEPPEVIYNKEYEEGSAPPAYVEAAETEEEDNNLITIPPASETTASEASGKGLSTSMIVYNADTEQYEVYDVASVLEGGSLEDVESVQERLRALNSGGVKYDYVELIGGEASEMTDKQEQGFRYLIIAVSGIGILLIGLYIVRRRSAGRK